MNDPQEFGVGLLGREFSRTSELSWAGTPLTWAASIIVVLAAIGLGLLAWRRSGYSPAVAGLEILRTCVVAFVAVLLNQPEWVQSYQPSQKPTIAVLFDRSPSMLTKDVPVQADLGQNADRWISRAEAIQPLIDAEVWKRLNDSLNVVIEPITGVESEGTPTTEAAGRPEAATDSGREIVGTDLGAPLLRVAERTDALLGVVLISDGDWNLGRPPVEAASRLQARGIPIFTVPVGSPTRLPDLELAEFELPTFAPFGKPLLVPFSIESWLPRDVMTTVTMTVTDTAADAETSRDDGVASINGEESVSTQITLKGLGRTSDTLVWEPTRTGDYQISIEVPVEPDEAVSENNRRIGQITIREEQLRVLVVESTPRWEYRYLRNALSRDPGVQLSCLLFHPELDRRGGGTLDYIQSFPDSVESLAEFDVVILGDVGLDDGQLTAADCGLIKGLVERQAAGLVLIPGWQGRQLSLLQSELADLFPVRLDESQPRGFGSPTPGQLRLTESGRRSLLTRLDDDREENLRVWDELPGFQWYAPVLRAKPGAEVLAVHRELSNGSGSLPLLATQPFGVGKVLFLGTDGAWRWREGVEDKYHYRFWGQVVRWMAYQRNMARGESMRMYHTPDQPQLQRTVSLYAHVMDEAGEPLQGGEVLARIVAPSGKAESLRMIAEGDRWGVYHGRLEPAEPGRHDVTLICRQTSATLEMSLFVRGDASEVPGKPARPEVLEELALVSGGVSLAPDQIEQIIDTFAAMPSPPPTVRRVAIWSHPITAVVILCALGLFWVGRKSLGLL